MHYISAVSTASWCDVSANSREKAESDALAGLKRITAATYLNAAYPEQWIGRAGPTPWPARSPDMNPLDFYLRGRLKSLVYTSAAPNVQVLQQRIEHACGIVRDELNGLCNVQRSLKRRAQRDGIHIGPTVTSLVSVLCLAQSVQSFQTKWKRESYCRKCCYDGDACVEPVDRKGSYAETSRYWTHNVTTARDDRHLVLMAVTDRTASSTVLSRCWSTAMGVDLSASTGNLNSNCYIMEVLELEVLILLQATPHVIFSRTMFGQMWRVLCKPSSKNDGYRFLSDEELLSKTRHTLDIVEGIYHEIGDQELCLGAEGRHIRNSDCDDDVIRSTAHGSISDASFPSPPKRKKGKSFSPEKRKKKFLTIWHKTHGKRKICIRFRIINEWVYDYVVKKSKKDVHGKTRLHCYEPVYTTGLHMHMKNCCRHVKCLVI
ncbi:hypothetical protein ANN_27833 [Periplaneta americana]|uniref:Uncharacterized protein n=1 Tax=Periplaneta americana TaxID=6978 RepID=A0ABQ8RV97_PERAM|nr:hypothetical protein ANN_27833 [Periplaneta americana]